MIGFIGVRRIKEVFIAEDTGLQRVSAALTLLRCHRLIRESNRKGRKQEVRAKRKTAYQSVDT